MCLHVSGNKWGNSPDAWGSNAGGAAGSRHTLGNAGKGCRAHGFCTREKHKYRFWGCMIRAQLSY